MIEQNVLLGNGINIEFSGNDDYKNFAILQRMCANLSTPGRYIDIFNGIIDSSDMYDFMEKLNKWFKNHALKGIESLSLFENEDELRSILEMSKRYSHTDPSVIDIGLEDYLLGLKFFNAKYKEDALDFNTLYQGITMLMLDAIYNDGRIEKLYENMECFKDELKKFKNIFTLNYDTNIDTLLGQPIYHLHGSFNSLHHEYRDDTLKGWLLLQTQGSLVPYIKGKEYLYCDAVFGFSGNNKMARIDKYNEIYDISGSEKILEMHPELKTPKYPVDEFKRIKGVLHMIGVCPNNDSHIFKMINENNNVNRILYYSANDKDSQVIQKVMNKPVQIINVFKYWKKIRSLH